MPSSTSSSSSSEAASPAQQQNLVISADMSKIITETILSNVSVDLSGLNLDLAVKINVDQKILVKVPLTAKVTYDEAHIVPVIEQHETVDAEQEAEPEKAESVSSKSSKSSSKASEIEELVQDVEEKVEELVAATEEQQEQEPVFNIGRSKCVIEVKNLPKMDGRFGKADPYFKFYIDGIHQFGGADIAKSNTLQAKWEPGFPLRNRQLQYGRTIKVEFYDKDRFNRDDLIGITEFSASELYEKRSMAELSVKGIKSDKAGTKMSITLV